MDPEKLQEEYNRLRDQGMSPEEARVQAAYNVRRDAGDSPDMLKGLARSAVQGLSLNFGDEAEAAFRALISDRSYGEVVDEIRGEMGEFRRENPALSIGAELAGGAPYALVPALNVTRGATLGKQVAQGAVAGGAVGAAAGAGAAQGGAGRRATGAALGGGAGAALGGGMPLFMQGARNVYRGVQGLAQPDEVADQLLLQKIADSGSSPQDLARQLAPGDVLADATEGTRRLARGAQAIPNETNEAVATQLGQRVAGAPDDLNDVLTRRLAQPDRDVFRVADELKDRLRANARSVYNEAYEVGEVADDEIAALLERSLDSKAGEVAWEEALDIARLEGVDLSQSVRVSPEGDVTVLTQPTVRLLDYLKRGLDGAIDSGFRGRALSPKRAQVLRDEIRNPLVQRLDELVPEYRAARAQYRGDLEAMEALEIGQSAIRSDPRELARMVEGLDEGSREMFRLGFVDALRRSRVDDRTGRRLTNAFDDTMQRRLRALFGPDRAQAVADDVARIANQNRTAESVLGGSPTARIQQDVSEIQDASGAGALQALFAGRPGQAVGEAMRQVGPRLSGMSTPRVARATSERLFSPQPTDVLERLLGRRQSFADMMRKQAGFRLGSSAYSGLLAPMLLPKEPQNFPR